MVLQSPLVSAAGDQVRISKISPIYSTLPRICSDPSPSFPRCDLKPVERSEPRELVWSSTWARLNFCWMIDFGEMRIDRSILRRLNPAMQTRTRMWKICDAPSKRNMTKGEDGSSSNVGYLGVNRSRGFMYS